MDRTWSAPLLISPGPSGRLTLLLVCLHGGAIGCVALADLPAPLQGALAVWALGNGWRSVGLHGTRRAAGAVVAAAWDGAGRWRLRTRDHRLLDATVEPGGFSHPALVVLCFRAGRGARLALVLTPDMVPEQTFRRLRVRLRIASSRAD